MVIAVDVVRRLEDLKALRPGWNTLLAASGADSLFLTWEWILTWWEVYGGPRRRLHVLAARNQAGRLVGIAPLMIERHRVLSVWKIRVAKFIGDGGDVTPEYLEIFTVPGFEKNVVDACIAQLLGDPSIDSIDLRPLAAASRTHRYLVKALGALGARGDPRVVPDSINPVLELPATAREFLNSRSRNYRKKIGEYERRCERELNATLRVSRDARELQEDMDALVSLHHKRWRGLSRAFQSSHYSAFHARLSSRMLDRNWVRLFTLETANGPLALLYCFAYGGRYYFYQAGRDPDFDKHRVGLVIMHKAILEAIDEGATAFDFLRGDEIYKYRWATSEVRSVRVVYWRNRAISLAARLYYGLRRIIGKRGRRRPHPRVTRVGQDRRAS